MKRSAGWKQQTALLPRQSWTVPVPGFTNQFIRPGVAPTRTSTRPNCSVMNANRESRVMSSTSSRGLPCAASRRASLARRFDTEWVGFDKRSRTRASAPSGQWPLRSPGVGATNAGRFVAGFRPRATDDLPVLVPVNAKTPRSLLAPIPIDIAAAILLVSGRRRIHALREAFSHRDQAPADSSSVPVAETQPRIYRR